VFFMSFMVLEVRCDVFLGHHAKDETMKEDVEQTLLFELSVESSTSVKQVEEELRPLFATLPNNGENRLEPSVVRFALTRYFAKKHGWYIKGLERSGEYWNASSPATIMKSQVPTYIQGLFENRLHRQGLGLEDLALFAQAMVELIEKEILADTHMMYDLLGFLTTSRITKDQLMQVVRMTLVARLEGVPAVPALKDFAAGERSLIKYFLAWKLTNVWAYDTYHSVGYLQKSKCNPFRQGYDFDYSLDFVKELAKGYGHVQNLECREHKNMLMDLEYEGTGRVPLSRFYSGGLETGSM